MNKWIDVGVVINWMELEQVFNVLFYEKPIMSIWHSENCMT